MSGLKQWVDEGQRIGVMAEWSGWGGGGVLFMKSVMQIKLKIVFYPQVLVRACWKLSVSIRLKTDAVSCIMEKGSQYCFYWCGELFMLYIYVKERGSEIVRERLREKGYQIRVSIGS